MKIILLTAIVLMASIGIGPGHIEAPEENDCKSCHSGLFEREFIHAVMEDECENCHTPVNPIHPQEGVKGFSLAERIPDLCYICHENKNVLKRIHYPVEEGECLACHSPHSSDRPSLIISSSGSNICFECHDDAPFTTRVKHQPVEQGLCGNCHDPHQSDNPGLLRKSPDELCMNCHTKGIEGAKGTVAGIGELLKRSPVVHAALDIGGCAECHNAHGSAYSSLLIASFPENYYAPGTLDSYELCFLCHDSDLLVLEKTSSATNFRNGEQNLHNLHLAGDHGRSCLLCHDMHAASNPHLVLSEVPWGGWTMKMNYVTTETGGTCFTGCHGELSYSRK